MIDTAADVIIKNIANHSVFFSTQITKDIGFRITQLRKLKKAILQYQEKIALALWDDLHKSPEEAYVTEISIVLSEITHHIKHLKKWASPKKSSNTAAFTSIF